MGSHSLKNQCKHIIANAYRAGYGESARTRATMRAEGVRSIAVKSSRVVIENDTMRFCDFIKEKHPTCKKIDEAKNYIQDWIDDLQNKGLSPKTIHGYVDHLGVVFHVSPGEYKLHTGAKNIKDRAMSKSELRDRESGKYERYYAIAEATGLRRSELAALKYSDFYKGDDGYWYVHVKSGKGGKDTEQRLYPGAEDSNIIKNIIMHNQSSSRVLSCSDIAHNTSTHRIRRSNAQQLYQHYLERCSTQEGRRDVFREICDYCDKYYARKDKKRDWKNIKDIRILSRDLDSVYKTRGAQRKELQTLGYDVEFDRLSALAVSVFHLAHWRCNVTVQNYFK